MPTTPTMPITPITPLPYYYTNSIPTGPLEQPLILDWPIITQPIVFNVIYKTDGTGNLTQDVIIKQVNQLNNAFSGKDAINKNYRNNANANINFVLKSINYINNDDWFTNCALWTYQPIIKKNFIQT